MSIEVMIENLTKAVNHLASVWEGTNSTDKPAEKPAKKAPAKKKTPLKVVETEDKPDDNEEVETPAAAETKAPTIKRSDVRTFCTKVLKGKGTLPILKEFGVAQFSELTDDQIPEFYEAAQAAAENA